MAVAARRRPTVFTRGCVLVLLLASMSAAAAETPPAVATGVAANPPAGQRAYDAGETARAYAIWSNLAAHGDDQAAMNLAAMLDQGNGVARDPVAALHWYTVAAEHGSPEAEFDVGIMLDSGRGTDRDVASAAVWYARAATHRHRRAEYNLGQLYAVGEGVPRNPDVARAWYKLAAANGILAATSKLPAAGKQLPPGAPELAKAAPQYPVRDAKVAALPPTGEVEFVWAAPPQPGPVMFYLEVDETTGGQPHLVASRYVAETAVALDLGTAAGGFVWRVYVVDQRHQRYAIGDWQPFSIVAPAPAG